MDDKNKILIKNHMRNKIYRHRFYINSAWAMREERIIKLENVMNTINTDNPIYEYLYLFKEKYSFPLINPVPYDEINNLLFYREKNDGLREEEVKKGMVKFESEGLSIRELISLVSEYKENVLGECLAKFYGDSFLSEKILDILLETDLEGKVVYDYIRCVVNNNRELLQKIIKQVKTKKPLNINLIVNIYALEVFNDKELLIANASNEIKKEYWQRPNRVCSSVNEKVALWAICECERYGTLNAYLGLLFDLKDCLSIEQLYYAFMRIENISTAQNSVMTDYYLEELLKKLQEQLAEEGEKYAELARIEWKLSNVLEWDQMKCTQYYMKNSPAMYAQLLEAIYFNGEEANAYDAKEKEIANSVYEGFHKAQFCPAEINGKVKYENIHKWVEEFYALLDKQKQLDLFGHALGRLLVYSPTGDDGYMPCEAVRQVIGEYFEESLKSAYKIAEYNKRGIYTPNAGKSEMQMSILYKRNANRIRDDFPYTAVIYDELSLRYNCESVSERERAEEEY